MRRLQFRVEFVNGVQGVKACVAHHDRPAFPAFNTRSEQGTVSEAEHELDQPAQNLIREQEEDRAYKDHDEDHHCRHQSFLPRWPCDLGDFLADLLEKFDRICTRHAALPLCCPINPRLKIRLHG